MYSVFIRAFRHTRIVVNDRLHFNITSSLFFLQRSIRMGLRAIFIIACIRVCVQAVRIYARIFEYKLGVEE